MSTGLFKIFMVLNLLHKPMPNADKYIQLCSKSRTRTHLMVRHRKSPRSQRNLMVIDPLTPSQGHQFYRRLKLLSVSWSTAHPL